MRQFNPNGNFHMFGSDTGERGVSSMRSGLGPLPESELLERIAKATTMKESYERAIADMWRLLAGTLDSCTKCGSLYSDEAIERKSSKCSQVGCPVEARAEELRANTRREGQLKLKELRESNIVPEEKDEDI